MEVGKMIQVKSTDLSCKESKFGFQHPHRGPYLSVTPVLGYLMSSSGHCRQLVCTWYIYIHKGKMFIAIKSLFLRHLQ